MAATNPHILNQLETIREEAEGDRGELYELYGSAIQPVLSPLLELLEANLETNPELVEAVLSKLLS